MSSIQQAFEKFHAENPHVYLGLVKLARQAKDHGQQTYGIKALFEVLRWALMVSTAGDDFKLNNNFTSRYARLIMEREPDLQGFFNVRALTEEGALPPRPETTLSAQHNSALDDIGGLVDELFGS